ncbi:SRPBCC family protein [Plantactinospora sp. WMMB782]|uniref:SRPBCC family protein n=1 Tax=Plantactinospora sp. WMMB782 TaxID=3404121 RepID=UPI003B94285E
MTATDRHRIPIVRVFDAPRELVFRTWTRAEEVGTWFAPPGFSVTRCELDARPGGRWQVEYRSTGGETYREYGEFREVVPPERLVLTLAQADADGNTTLETLVTVLLADRGGKTEMTFEQTGFESVAVRDAVAEGWRGCFDKLDTHLAKALTEKEGR